MNVNKQIFGNGSGQRSTAMALVITLILLSLITFMTVTFLIISQRERGSVSTTSDATTARFAADAALERAKAEILAPILAITNDQAYDILVSTNYISRDGFVGLPYLTNWNVNYDFNASIAGNPPLTAGDLQTNIANLLYDPRAPVYMQTNPLFPGQELRFYVDLNRNGRFETNGWWPVLSGVATAPTYDLLGSNVALNAMSPPNVLSNYFTGDPEWVGQLEHPDQFHSSSNRFTSRWAFIAIPISKTLDINYIDNQAMAPRDRPILNSEGFYRNQGVGSWEINLAAFFVDLNANVWNPSANPYFYRRPVDGNQNSGAAFEDAVVIKNYRYNQNRALLKTFNQLYGPVGSSTILNDNIDEYSDGPLQITTAVTNDNDTILNSQTVGWAGADNTNHIFTTQDYFDTNNILVQGAGFVSRLKPSALSANPNNTYDRYTYYRMLSQMGTDSRAERGKININYVNVDGQGNIIPMLATNFVRWGALQFFTNAADHLLRTYTTEWFKQDPSNYLATFYNIHTNFYFGNSPNFANLPYFTNNPYGWGLTNIPFYGMTNTIPSFGLTNIPVFINQKPVYSAAVHRVLQLAANIFDATTNRPDTTYPYLPSVFRPVYSRDINTNVYISGFFEELNTLSLDLPYENFGDLPLGTTTNRNIYGMPWVIGAKKGYPNFNQASFRTDVFLQRVLLLTKAHAGDASLQKIEQLWDLDVSNTVQMSAWNSYTPTFPRPLELRMTNESSYLVSTTPNASGDLVPFSWITVFGLGTNGMNITSWRGYGGTIPARATIQMSSGGPIVTNATFALRDRSDTLLATPFLFSSTNVSYNSGFANEPMPQMYLITSNRFRFALIDKSVIPNRVVDYVNLDMSSNVFNISGTIASLATCPDPNAIPIHMSDFWCTNAIPVQKNYPFDRTEGVNFQIRVSHGDYTAGSIPTTVWDDPNQSNEISSFAAFVDNNDKTSTYKQTPFNPYFVTNIISTWQANDPLVHYTLDDLRYNATLVGDLWGASTNTPTKRYHPWQYDTGTSQNDPDNQMSKKDPMIRTSDDWDFPTNVIPNVGWIGRVHRGTPWQTVYLKAAVPSITDWRLWSGHPTNFPAMYTLPSQDRLLFDVFTTAINDNATRGQLSVNQSGLAAWSAVLSGVIGITNNPDGSLGPIIIQPAALSSEVAQIVQSINAVRASSNLVTAADIYPNKQFAHEGDVLAAPILTDNSPYIVTNYVDGAGYILTPRDEVFERIPQQIMGLLTLKHEPRYVIYAFGQALRPADHSIVMSGPLFGLCTNYQVTGETVTRAVVRIENAPRPGEPNKSPRAVIESFNILPPD